MLPQSDCILGSPGSHRLTATKNHIFGQDVKPPSGQTQHNRMPDGYITHRYEANYQSHPCEYTESALRQLVLIHSYLFSLFPVTSLSSCRLPPLVWSCLAVGRCLRMGKTLPAVALQKVASQTSSNTREKAARRQNEPFIPTHQSKRAAAPLQACLRPRTNQLCSAAWSTFSSFSPDLSPCISSLRQWLGVRGVRSCSRGPWWQGPIIQSHAQDQGRSGGSVSRLSLLPVSSFWNAPVSPSTSQKATSSRPQCRKSSLVRASNDIDSAPFFFFSKQKREKHISYQIFKLKTKYWS